MSRHCRPRYLATAIFAAAAFLQTALAGAQSTYGTVTGTVTDQSGSVLPGVVITTTNLATGITRNVVTTSLGEYQVRTWTQGPICCYSSSTGSVTPPEKFRCSHGRSCVRTCRCRLPVPSSASR